MEVRKIKSIVPGFEHNSGPFETVQLGIDVDGTSIMMGKFYNGPGMVEWHRELQDKLEKFIDECVLKFQKP